MTKHHQQEDDGRLIQQLTPCRQIGRQCPHEHIGHEIKHTLTSTPVSLAIQLRTSTATRLSTPCVLNGLLGRVVLEDAVVFGFFQSHILGLSGQEMNSQLTFHIHNCPVHGGPSHQQAN